MTATPHRRHWSNAIALTLALLLPLPAPASAGPRDVVQEVIDAGIAILERDELSSTQKRDELQAMVEKYFDFETLSSLVLARKWRGLAADEKQAFIAEFKTHLALTYGKNVADYNDEKVLITGDKEEARGDWTVRTKIVRKDAPEILVNYRLRQRGGTWQMIDVVVEGVSLVSNWRAQFREVLGKNNSIDHLIEMLRHKNAELRAGNTGAG